MIKIKDYLKTYKKYKQTLLLMRKLKLVNFHQIKIHKMKTRCLDR